MATLFIADTHFDDSGIIKFEDRPFSSVENMNNAMIQMWNAYVKPQDTVWHLGDFIWNDGKWDDTCKDRIKEISSQLNGTKNLVMGNHDKALSVRDWMELGFNTVYDIPVLYKGFYILSHEPVYVNENMSYVNIYGHVHGNPNYKDYSRNGCCICVERTNYTPVNFYSIRDRIMSENSAAPITPNTISIDTK